MRNLLVIFLSLVCACGERPASEPVSTDAAPPAEEDAPEEPKTAPEDTWEKVTDLEITGPRARARHILIAYKNAQYAPDKVDRDKEEARELAAQVRSEILAGADFAEKAKALSDGSTAKRGGELGTFAKGVMHENFEAAVFALEVGALSGIVETPFGFHVIEREEVIEVRVAQVLVQWKGRHRSKSTRTKEAARAHIDEALELIQGGASFQEVAKSHSEGSTGKRGTDLGWFQTGQMVPSFEKAAFALKVGETTGVIESPLGFHIIHRVE